METQFPKIYGMQKAILRGKFTAIQAFSNKQPKLPSTFSFRKRRTNKAQSQQKKEKINIVVGINETKTKRQQKKSNETKNWFSEKINNIEKPLTKEK